MEWKEAPHRSGVKRFGYRRRARGYNQIVHAVPSHTVNTNERSLTTLGDQILTLNETFVERFDVTLSKFEDVCLMLLQ